MGDFEYLGEEEEPTGVGTDLFIRKNKPGPTVGVGYTIDIFENGVKSETKHEKAKKDIKYIIDEKKDKYNTQRAFQNENQLHITYKTKEERGEFPPPVVEKSTEEERKETAMENLDKELVKKANTINGLLQRLVDPTIPIKKRAEDLLAPAQTLGATPEQSGQNPSIGIEKQVADGMFEKLLEFLKEEASAAPTEAPEGEAQEEPVDFIPQTPLPRAAGVKKYAAIQLDNVYNKIKSWVSKVVEKLDLFEKDNPSQKVDRDAITSDISQRIMALKPGDNGLQEEDIKVLQEAIQKPKGIPQKTEALAEATGQEVTSPPVIGLEEPTLTNASEDSMKKLGNIADIVSKLVGEVGGKGDSTVLFDVQDIVKDKVGEDPEKLMQVQKALPENFPGCALNRGITDMLNKDKDENSVRVIEISASNFWDYAKNMNKIATIENAFEEWANKQSISLGQASAVWSKISNDISNLFHDRTAQWMDGAEEYEKTYFGKIAEDIKGLIESKQFNYINSTVIGIVKTVQNYLAAEDEELAAKGEFTIPEKVEKNLTSVNRITTYMNGVIDANILVPLRPLAVGSLSGFIRGIMKTIIELPIQETIQKYVDPRKQRQQQQQPAEQQQQQPVEQQQQQPVASQ